MRVVLLIGLLIGSAVASSEVNVYIDQLLNGVRGTIIEQGKDTVNVPDVNYNFEKKISFLTINGQLRCRRGYIQSLSSFRRSSDVNIQMEDNVTRIAIELTFDNLEFGYGSCEVKSNFISPSFSKVKMAVGTIAVKLKISIHDNEPNCQITVDTIHLNKLDGIKIQTGTRFINKVVDKVLNMVARRFRNNAKNLINESIKDRLTIPPIGLCEETLELIKSFQKNRNVLN